MKKIFVLFTILVLLSSFGLAKQGVHEPGTGITNPEIKRYQEYYQTNPYDENNYDLVLDTSDISALEVTDKIVVWLEKKL